jgi:hypothetical protein
MPVGRGQPLPPPGQPLPGPPNAFRKSWTTALGSIGRKRAPSNTPSVISLTEEERGAALSAARKSSEVTPPLPPRPNSNGTPPVPPLPATHSRKGSAHSRRSSAKLQRASADERTLDNVLVIKAPETEGDEADDVQEKQAGEVAEDNSQDKYNEPPRKTKEVEANEQVDTGTSFERGDDGPKPETAETHGDELEINGDEISETSDAKKLDRDSLELLQTLVH